MSKTQHLDILKRRQASLKKQISDNLDLLIGSVARSPTMRYYNLTTKIEGKTVTRYLRKGLVPTAKRMTNRHKKVRTLMQQLSTVNWEILKLESE